MAMDPQRMGIDQRPQASRFSLFHSGLYNLIPGAAGLEFSSEDIAQSVCPVQGLSDAIGRILLTDMADIGLPLHVRAKIEIDDPQITVKEVAPLDNLWICIVFLVEFFMPLDRNGWLEPCA